MIISGRRSTRGIFIGTIVLASVTLFLLSRSQYAAPAWTLPDFDYHSWSSGGKPSTQEQPEGEPAASGAVTSEAPRHPIDFLVKQATERHAAYLEKQVTGVREAAAVYRQRRGRHPPPRFDRWVKFAEDRGALIVEEFFDQLYNDVDPLWGVATAELRKFPATWPFTISIRNGTLRRWSDEPMQGFIDFMSLWQNGIKAIPKEDLPDVDLAFNSDDEPHVFVPWEKMQAYRADAEARKHTSPSTADRPIYPDFTTYPLLPSERPKPGNGCFSYDMFPGNIPLWEIGKGACSPTTNAEEIAADTDYQKLMHWPESPKHMYEGYVQDWEAAKSACENPYIRDVHGSFVYMQTYSINADRTQKPYNAKERAVITDLVPMLSGCKIRDMNQELLVPAGVHWQATNPTVNVQEDFRVPWEEKKNVVLWRGSASGGINTKENWTRFHRHRFMAMLNGTLVAEHQAVADAPLPTRVPGGDPVLPHNFPLPNPSIYPLAVLQDTAAEFANWIASVTNGAFTDLRCWPGWGKSDECSYNGAYYSTAKKIPGNELWQYKMLPDLDGASYSGRFRAFLQSGSLPVKATIYDEWSDSRLVPWRHFVPMDNTFMDWWGMLEYFLGYGDKVPARDDVAKSIAESSAEWANKVLRREDMEIYMYRLILELARVSDDRRDNMGYVDDL